MQTDFDLTVIGSGFGGSLLAMIARRLGLSVALLERGRHPRFAIGESTSPLMNLLIEQLAERYDLPRLLPLTTYGSWQRAYPEISCGLKRGFTYFHHKANQPYETAPDRSNQLLVAASPNDEVGDTHWLRSDVDAFLVQEAIMLGVDYRAEVQLSGGSFAAEGSILEGTRAGEAFRLSSRFVVDASGPGGFLTRTLNLPHGAFPGYPATRALYSHFTDVPRCETMDAFRPSETPPYPLDDAALHHVFDGGWMWVLRFNNGVTSAGCAVEAWLAEELELEGSAAAWSRFLHRFPSIEAQFAGATPVQPFVYAPRLASRVETVTGPGWALLPSAAAFVDPLFSTGMPLTLLGIERLGRILEETWGTDAFASRIEEYGAITRQEADWTAHFIATSYVGMANFPLFSAFSMFYFAAASYAEMARRLPKSSRLTRYLAADHAPFADGVRQCARLLREQACNGSQAGLQDFARQVAQDISCLNIAGLCDPRKRNWYGVDMQDVIDGAALLGMTSEEMRHVVATAPWASGTVRSP
jgi:FADH2 O2-dependent halogenase